MGGRAVTCRIFIVFHHALFAQGIRSLLRGRRGMQVIGMETDTAKALEAVVSLRPEVLIVEESDAGARSPTLAAILQRHPAGRVVALDLDHNFATVYDRQRVVTSRPADLVKAIRGGFRERGTAFLAAGSLPERSDGTVASAKSTGRRKARPHP